MAKILPVDMGYSEKKLKINPDKLINKRKWRASNTRTLAE